MNNTWLTSSNWAEFITALAFIVLLVAELIYLHNKEQNYFVRAMTLPTMVLATFYMVLTLDIEPIASNTDLRLAIFRPSLIALVAFMAAFFLNGRINTEIGRWIHRPRNR